MIKPNHNQEQLLKEIALLKAELHALKASQSNSHAPIDYYSKDFNKSSEYLSLNYAQQSEDRFRDLANLLPQIVYEMDTEGALTFVNKHALITYGFSHEEFHKGINVFQALIPEDRERARNSMKNRLLGFENSKMEYTSLKKDGSTFPILLYANPIFNKNICVGFRGIIIDITEQKEAENTLKKSEEKHRSILDNSPNIFYSHTVDHLLTYMSPRVKDILGYTQEEVQIKWTELASDHPINKIGFEKTILAIKTGKRQESYELELIKKNGEKIWVDVWEFPQV